MRRNQIMPQQCTSFRWYAVQCKPRQEWRALEHLERQGYACYLPLLRTEQVQRGRRQECQEPLFPRYLFIKLEDITQSWHPIRSTRGVIRLVGFNERPLPVKDDIIELMRERLAQKQVHVPYLREGERVRITEGAFADMEAIFVTGDGEERVVLLMNILHHEQRLTFPMRSVRKLG
jgi:transcriptional antiterminator RfaH